LQQPLALLELLRHAFLEDVAELRPERDVGVAPIREHVLEVVQHLAREPAAASG
jgi:hypothetical protein